jgi:hypothetical protein
MKAQRGGGRVIELHIHSLSARRGRWWMPRPGRFIRGKDTCCPLYSRLVGLQGRSERVRKIVPWPGFDLRTVQNVASRYTDWDTQKTWNDLYTILLLVMFMVMQYDTLAFPWCRCNRLLARYGENLRVCLVKDWKAYSRYLHPRCFVFTERRTETLGVRRQRRRWNCYALPTFPNFFIYP